MSNQQVNVRKHPLIDTGTLLTNSICTVLAIGSSTWTIYWSPIVKIERPRTINSATVQKGHEMRKWFWWTGQWNSMMRGDAGLAMEIGLWEKKISLTLHGYIFEVGSGYLLASEREGWRPSSLTNGNQARLTQQSRTTGKYLDSWIFWCSRLPPYC